MSLQEASANPQRHLQPRTCVLYGRIEPHSVYDIKVGATLSREPKQLKERKMREDGDTGEELDQNTLHMCVEMPSTMTTCYAINTSQLKTTTTQKCLFHFFNNKDASFISGKTHVGEIKDYREL